ncbi:MAG: class I SAM-dependent methyltransferase [Elusimicrobia bacterium]|nr:class I SAM-dependent methyltransferase [Elusimicrobiota bacterium]
MLPVPYADPALYDLLHADGTGDECWLLDRLAARHGPGGKAALEPACGSGRYLAGLRRRGWEVFGYDRSPAMAAFARRRLGPGRAQVGDMRNFRTQPRFDLAFNLLSTFRHLMTDRDALAHLRSTAGALKPGGIFILGLDLAEYGADAPDEEAWTVRRSGKTWRHVMMTLPADRRRRRERILNFVDPPAGPLIESHYDLRSYDAQELADLIARSPFAIEAVYGPDGRRAELDGPELALWLVLKTA